MNEIGSRWFIGHGTYKAERPSWPPFDDVRWFCITAAAPRAPFSWRPQGGQVRRRRKAWKDCGHLTLDLSDTNCHAFTRPKSHEATGQGGWMELKLETALPPDANWLSLMLSCTTDGAACLDEVNVERMR